MSPKYAWKSLKPVGDILAMTNKSPSPQNAGTMGTGIFSGGTSYEYLCNIGEYIFDSELVHDFCLEYTYF